MTILDITNEDIIRFLKEKYGYIPKPSHIAHAKEVYGIPIRPAHNRKGERRWPCPKKRLPQIREAFVAFNML